VKCKSSFRKYAVIILAVANDTIQQGSEHNCRAISPFRFTDLGPHGSL
jgi:hypothetical protein